MPADVFFLVDLIQDVGVIDPLIRLLRRASSTRTNVLVSKQFYQRDTTTIWQNVLEKTCHETETSVHVFGSEWDAFQILQGRRGFLVSASESTLPPHALSHQVFKWAPSSFVTVTLQHGFECVGFLHNRAHDEAHGTRVGFAANVLCSWFGANALKSLAPDQAHKLYVAGPTSFIDFEPDAGRFSGAMDRGSAAIRCLICENLQSVRLESGTTRNDFIDEMFVFFDRLRDGRGEIVLRTHPAGRFTETDLTLPGWVTKSEGPLHETLRTAFDFGLSPPSSVLLDMIRAGIPVAVWRDGGGDVDIANYAGLPAVTSGVDWARLALRSRLNREEMIADQQRFMDRFDIPANVAERYLQLLTSSP